jgi:hypothetical protein
MDFGVCLIDEFSSNIQEIEISAPNKKSRDLGLSQAQIDRVFKAKNIDQQSTIQSYNGINQSSEFGKACFFGPET